MENSKRLYGALFRQSIFLMGLVLLNSACEKELDLSTLKPSSGGTTPVGKVSNSGFYVEALMPSANMSYYMHEQSVFTPLTCTVSQTEPLAAKRDILCILDIAELDLYFYGYSLNFNAPSSMCEYTEAVGYNYKLDVGGNGPTAITACYDNASGAFLSLISQTPVAVANVVPAITADSAGTFKCEWDHTADKIAANCCSGKYTLTKNISATGIGGCAAPIRVDNGGVLAWGGSAGNCFEGPGTRDPSTPLSKGPVTIDGFPKTSYLFDTSGTGINSEWKVGAPLKLEKGTNLFTANYYTPLNPAAPPTAYRDPWTFMCRDSAFDITARIRVYVRSWDTLAGFIAQTTDITNPATVEATYGEVVHDMFVWQNVGNAFPYKGYVVVGPGGPVTYVGD